MILLGLLLINVGWLIQFFKTTKDDHNLSPLFLVCYALGSGLIIYESITQKNTDFIVFNLLAFILSAAVLAKVKKL